MFKVRLVSKCDSYEMVQAFSYAPSALLSWRKLVNSPYHYSYHVILETCSTGKDKKKAVAGEK